MNDNDIHLVMISDSLIESSAPESDFITRNISISIIHIGAYDSINESEIMTMYITLSIIHTVADDSINEYEITIIFNL